MAAASLHWRKLQRFFTQPLVALSVQALVPSVGTALLLDSKDGRNILAAEIVVTTAIVSFYCGGCATLEPARCSES